MLTGRNTAIVLAGLIACGCWTSHVREDLPAGYDCTGDPSTASVLLHVVSVSAPSGGYVRVTLTDGQDYLFETSDPSTTGLVEIVESRHERHEPIFFEYVRDTRVVVDLGLPMPYRVLRITEEDEGALMEFETSAAIHLLPADQTCYALFLSFLRAALDAGTAVWVTHDSLYHVIDVRPSF